MKIVVYDGSFEGFLTAVFDYYNKLGKIKIEKDTDQLSFLENIYVKTDPKKAERVIKSLKENISNSFFLYVKRAFKSFHKNKDTIIARLIKLVFIKGIYVINSANKYAIAFRKMLKNYGSEAHALKGLLRLDRKSVV